jgi:hypothetical protein
VRIELKELLQPGVDVVDQAINIALCLWLSLDCVGQKDGRPKNWPDADTIHRFALERSFDDPTEASIGDSVARFPPKFLAAHLKEISGINIESTWYLDQHLRFNDSTRTLKVFMDAAWLQFMCENLREDRDSPQQKPKEASSHARLLNSPLLGGQSQLESSAAQNHSQWTDPKGNYPGSSEDAKLLATESGTINRIQASGVR